MDEDIIQIKTFGGFSLSVGEKAVGDQDNRSHQVWRVLEYLVAYRHREISQGEIIDALWPDETSDNPANALKNLVYRLRMLLTKAELPHAREMIICKGGTYSWNNSLHTVVDCEEFEDAIKRADNDSYPAGERVDEYLRAVAMFRGDFLGHTSVEVWAAPLTTYYHSLYMRSVHRASALLHQQGRNNDIMEVCRRALTIDQFDEGVHAALIRALAALRRPQDVIEHYQRVVTMFYNELGVKPSEELVGLYRELVAGVSHVEASLEDIKNDLRGNLVAGGAFVCEYEVFKDVYRLVARSAMRNGKAMFLVLLTVSPQGDKSVTTQEIGRGMEGLLGSVCISLRRGDVVTRFSPTQYLLLLSALTFENGQMVIRRILRSFKHNYPRSSLKIVADMQPIDPLNE